VLLDPGTDGELDTAVENSTGLYDAAVTDHDRTKRPLVIAGLEHRVHADGAPGADLDQPSGDEIAQI
jgi:hypothetical protein